MYIYCRNKLTYVVTVYERPFHLIIRTKFWMKSKSPRQVVLHYSFWCTYVNAWVWLVCHFVKHKYYRLGGRSRSNLFFRLPTVISYKLMAWVVTAQTPASIYTLTNETRRAHAHTSRHIPITNSCHHLY